MKQGLAVACVVVALFGCGRPVTAVGALGPESSDGGSRSSGAGGGGGGGGSDAGSDVPLCAVTAEAAPLEPPNHWPLGTTPEWGSNPPSSGSHYPQWAAYQEYTTPVPRGFYVHNLEHGAVVLLYNCALVEGGEGGSACEALRQGLREASASLPDDPLCTASVRVRTIITPDPLIPTPIAATAWGFVYRAPCVDLASLKAFVAAHYGKGREDECENGVTSF